MYEGSLEPISDQFPVWYESPFPDECVKVA